MQPCNWSPDNSKPLRRCLDANSGPSEEQPVLVTTEPSLHRLHWFRRGRSKIWRGVHGVSEKCCQQKGSQSSSRDQATGRDAEKQRGALASWLWSKAAMRVGQGDVNQVCTGLSALPELFPGSSWSVWLTLATRPYVHLP